MRAQALPSRCPEAADDMLLAIPAREFRAAAKNTARWEHQGHGLVIDREALYPVVDV